MERPTRYLESEIQITVQVSIFVLDLNLDRDFWRALVNADPIRYGICRHLGGWSRTSREWNQDMLIAIAASLGTVILIALIPRTLATDVT